jgi:hypothetical protein
MVSSFTYELFLIMCAMLFGLGILTCVTGILILVFRANSKEVRALAAQTTKLAQKGLAEEVAGLVGNASSLLEAVNQLIRTSAGVGVFLTILGLVMMVAAGLLILQIY